MTRATVSADGETITVHIPLTFRKRGGRKLVVTPDGAKWAPRPRVNNAMVKALARAGMTIDQIDLFEVNEAFAAVPMRFMRELNVTHEKVNVNGGAIAMGHPLGATGAMILGTLIDELHRRGLRYGLATLCVGGGMGIATIVERV